MNLRGVLQRIITCGKKKLAQVKGSNMARKNCGETIRKTGMKLKSMPRTGDLIVSPAMYMFVILLRSQELQRLIMSRLESKNVYSYCGDVQELVNHIELGSDFPKLILKTQELNGGQAIEVKKLLLSMNFEEVSILPTYCGGRISIRLVWKLKDPTSPWNVASSCSHPTLGRSVGTRK